VITKVELLFHGKGQADASKLRKMSQRTPLNRLSSSILQSSMVSFTQFEMDDAIPDSAYNIG
jgi:hypothetical protein